VFEQHAQTLEPAPIETRWVEVPEEPVVDEHELSVELGGPLEELDLGRDAGDDPPDLKRPGNLQTVGTEILEAGRVEQPG